MPDAGKDAEEWWWEEGDDYERLHHGALSWRVVHPDGDNLADYLNALQQQLAEARQELESRYDWNDDPRTKGLQANYVAADRRCIEAEQERDRYKAAAVMGVDALAYAISFMAGVFNSRGIRPAQYERRLEWVKVNNPRLAIEAALALDAGTEA